MVLRPHPYARRDLDSARQLAKIEQMLADDAAKSGRNHRYGDASSVQMSLFDCINAADVLISDVSAVASDWLFSEKPFALTNVLGADRADFEAAFPLARAAYVVDQDAANLDEVLEELLKIDSLAETRRESADLLPRRLPRLDLRRRVRVGRDEVRDHCPRLTAVTRTALARRARHATDLLRSLPSQ